jgi:hypothetical protein
MSTRNTWRLRWLPNGSIETVPSFKRAYEVVFEERERAEEGRSSAAVAVVVELDTGDGHGFEPYERITFKPAGGGS